MPPRIGEILVREGLVSPADVEAGLALARSDGLRLASALVRLERLHVDDASRALAQQLGVPAALEKHLDGRDLALAELLPVELARSLGALPLGVQRTEGALVVCVRDPVPNVIVSLEKATGRRVVLAVAAEIALLGRIDETYRGERSEPGIPIEFDVDIDTGRVDALDVGTLQLVDLDDRRVAKDHTLSDPGVRQSGMMAALELPRTLPRDGAVAAIAAADTRDQVVDAVLAFLRHRFAAGVVFSVKDGLALGQGGFGSDTIDDAVGALAIPLAQPSVLRAAFDQQAPYAGAPREAGVVQDRFFKLFGAPPARCLVVPVVIKGRVINLLYAHGARGGADADAAAELGAVAEAAADAFVRIIQKSKA